VFIQVAREAAAAKPASASQRVLEVRPPSPTRQAHHAQHIATTCHRYGCPAWRKFQATEWDTTNGTISVSTARAGLPRTPESGIAAEHRASTDIRKYASGVCRCSARPSRKGHIPKRSCLG